MGGDVAAHSKPNTEVRIEGKRKKLYQESQRRMNLAGLEIALWRRRQACADCELLTRWMGLWWCGDPVPARIVGVLIEWYLHLFAGLPAFFEFEGCGCCLSIKWNLEHHPIDYARQRIATMLDDWFGIEWNRGLTLPVRRNSCVRGRWNAIRCGEPKTKKRPSEPVVHSANGL